MAFSQPRTPQKFLIWLNDFFGFCVFQFNYPITGKRCWKDFCLNLEKDTMCSFGIRLHLNKAYPEISRGVDVTFTTKWQNRAQRNTAYPNQTQENLKSHSQRVEPDMTFRSSVRLRVNMTFLDSFGQQAQSYASLKSTIDWETQRSRVESY